jgi:hypothetical protein
MAVEQLQPTTVNPVIENKPDMLKDVINVSVNGNTFSFRIPSVKDKLKISALAAKLRRDNDPDGTGFAYGYDVMSMMFFDSIATFMTLYKDSDAPWVFTPNPEDNKPEMNLDKWPNDAPIVEVIEQFNTELATFRKARH